MVLRDVTSTPVLATHKKLVQPYAYSKDLLPAGEIWFGLTVY